MWGECWEAGRRMVGWMRWRESVKAGWRTEGDTLVSETPTGILLPVRPVALDVFQAEAGLVTLGDPVSVRVDDVVVRERVHTVIVPIKYRVAG